MDHDQNHSNNNIQTGTYSNNNSIKTWASSLKSSRKSMLKLRKLTINMCICMYIIHIYTHNILSNKKQ